METQRFITIKFFPILQTLERNDIEKGRRETSYLFFFLHGL
nr:MAG TPA: hypothetical protein [Crassvirales sp.]